MTQSDILIYQNPDGKIRLDVRLEDETVWLTQDHMAELFGKAKSTINEHIRNIFAEGELIESEVMKKFGISEFQQKAPNFYNLDVIISVGYRVKSQQGTQFRIWATQRLKEYIVKGFALNDERFKSGQSMNYFSELQERIREIRLSERFFYQKIKGIYTTSIDYDPKDEKTIEFFKVIQNKLLWAISEQTAAELAYRRVDAALPLMGMQSLDKKGDFPLRKSDVIIHLNGRELLNHAGKISHQMALEKSAGEYDKYRENQRQLQHEENLEELEQDIKQMKSHRKGGES